MSDIYLPHVVPDGFTIQNSWQRIAISRAGCAEARLQIAKSRILLEESRHILGATQRVRTHNVAYQIPQVSLDQLGEAGSLCVPSPDAITQKSPSARPSSNILAALLLLIVLFYLLAAFGVWGAWRLLLAIL